VSAALDPARIEALFDSLADLEPDDAARRLAEACEGEPELREAVERLLSHDRDVSPDFLAPRVDLALAALSQHSTVHSSPDQPSRARLDERGFPMLELPDRYRDAGHIGRGGMGDVRAIRDVELGREIAAKMLDRGLATRPALLQGFVDEAQITAQLEHPNIVPVYDFGVDFAGTLYFTMKRIQGRTFHAMLQDPQLVVGSSERLSVGFEVFLKTCDAVAFAHSHGVIHRDIKPANIMVGKFGEVYLMDWGLAQVRGSAPDSVDVRRKPGAPGAPQGEGCVGTPSFMAPEVARRQRHRVDERADIFALGGVLYQIVTGRPPFDGATVEEVLAKAASYDFAPPDASGEVLVPRRLALVIEKAMAREPEDRYSSASELASQLRSVIERGIHLPRETFQAGQTIVREGEIGQKAYIITRGQCRVYKGAGNARHLLRTIGPGTLFGETAILKDAPRTATVVAEGDVTVLALSRSVLETASPPTPGRGSSP
jgi:eukaryotic-like serine/threonine-protein kinase